MSNDDREIGENLSLHVPRIQVNTRFVCRTTLAAGMLAFVVIFTRLTFTLYDRFAYMSFDLGIFNQAVWLIAHGKTPFVMLRGVHILGDHFSLLLYLIALPYRLRPGPKTLLLIQTIAFALGAVPAYALARRRLHDEGYGLLFGLVYLLYPAHQWSITYEFHPDTFATPLIFVALYALDAKRIGMYVTSIVLVCTIKESAGLTVACIGIWAIYSEFLPSDRARPLLPKFRVSPSAERVTPADRTWRRSIGVLTILFGIGMIVVSMRTISAFNNHQPSAYFDLYAQYGSSPAAILRNLVRSPASFLSDVFQFDNLYYFFHLIGPLGFLPLLAPEIILIALPMLLVNFMAARSGMHSTEEYYNSFITPFLFLAAIVGFARLQRSSSILAWAGRALLPVWVLSAQFLGPLIRPVDTISSAQPAVPAITECAEAIALIPEKAKVSTQMVPGSHLSSRANCYAFPNPFVQVAWGNTHPARHEIESITDARLPYNLSAAANSPTALQSAEYVVLCPCSNQFPLSHARFAKMVVALLQSRNYETCYVGRYVIVLHRTPLHSARLLLLAERTGRPVSTPDEIESAYWHWAAAQIPTPVGGPS